MKNTIIEPNAPPSEGVKLSLTTVASPLILAGDGYSLIISPEAIARKKNLLASARMITAVTSNDESADAQFVARKLAEMRIEVEKSRKILNEPVLAKGRANNAVAADFAAEIIAEETRTKSMVGEYATSQARLKAEKEAEERRAFEEARRTREDALAKEAAAVTAAAPGGGIAALLAAREAAKAAEAERQETLAARMQASAEVAGTKVAEGVRFAWDFEVTDIHSLADRRADLVTIEPKRALILSMLKLLEEQGENVELVCRSLGLKAFKKPVVSSR